MSDFPTGFASATVPLDESLFRGAELDALHELASRGFEVHTGLTPEMAGHIYNMSLQPSIKEYCPGDSARRFSDQEAAEHWLAKGRCTFLLMKRDDDNLSLVGYGWSGRETSPHVQGGQTTFALRVGEQGQGQGLATPFSRLIIWGTAATFGAQDFWLETWKSNGGAVHIYDKLGFELVSEEFGSRPTAAGETVEDSRLYMRLPNNLLPS
ncbi:MAG TPA: GNAT family N-acetyltransferase [Candidatus Saccharimonadia bacterium]|nr:GNAT family N-acetyltransferase [Candidatus Saccharimonadia bacterium]